MIVFSSHVLRSCVFSKLGPGVHTVLSNERPTCSIVWVMLAYTCTPHVCTRTVHLRLLHYFKHLRGSEVSGDFSAMLRFFCFLYLTLALAGPSNKRQAKPTTDAPMMSHADAQCAYRLMEAMCPYPDEAMSRSAPHAWEVCAALGRATSLSSACVFTHMVILISLTLNALQTRYGGILGKFPNLLMLQHGAPGEGKSVALWLVFHILYYFDDTRTKLKLKEWNTNKEQHRLAVQAGEQDDKDAPPKPEHADSVHNKGCLVLKEYSAFL